ncbi:MAG: Ig-like domain repeat protein [Propionibacteriaceae bacterium]|nr:Ig-like domain repeat protein [Propionibacteriaceae bacterium]
MTVTTNARQNTTTKQYSLQQNKKITIKATVKSGSKAASGKVTFYDGSKKLKTVSLKSGVAKLTIKVTKLGTHTYTAKYIPKGKSKSTANGKAKVNVYSLSIKTDKVVYEAYVKNYFPLTVTASYSGKFTTSGYIDFWDGAYRNEFSGDKYIGPYTNPTNKKFSVTRTVYLGSESIKKNTTDPDAAANTSRVYTVSFTTQADADQGTTAMKTFTVKWLSNVIAVNGQTGKLVLPNSQTYTSTTGVLSGSYFSYCSAKVTHLDNTYTIYYSTTAANLDANHNLVVPVSGATDSTVEFEDCATTGAVAITP